jgi:xanthine/CO dehydrogenase XdhC/CoxF family maturation factor
MSATADEVIAQQRSTYQTSGNNREFFFDYLPPRLQTIVFGASPEAESLAVLSRTLGYAVTILDERPGYLRRRHAFPAGVRVTTRSTEQLRAELKLDGRCACIIATHNAAYDERALRLALSTRCPYIGLLGPRSRFLYLIERLKAVGHCLRPADMERLYSPIGLDVGGETPEQIALAIISEIQAVFSGRRGGFLRDSSRPMHTDAEMERVA